MATWRRSADSEIHVLVANASLARCGADATLPGPERLEADQPVCGDCAFAVLHDASDAEDCLTQLKLDRARAPKETHEHSYKIALGAMRALVRTVPVTGETSGPLTEAELVLQTGDADRAFVLVRRWRAEMRNSGVFPSA